MMQENFQERIIVQVWARDYRDRRAIQPDICFYPDIVPPQVLAETFEKLFPYPKLLTSFLTLCCCIEFYLKSPSSQNLQDSPVNAVTTRFVKTATNKMRCPIFCLSWTPEGRRLITGRSKLCLSRLQLKIFKCRCQ